MVLCSQEESPRWVGAIVSGAAKVSVYTEDGGEVLLGLRGPGTLIGELEAADGKPRSATTTALESTEALIMPRSDFIRYLSSHADMRPAWLLIEALCLRVRDAETMRVGYASYDITGRVAQLLVELATRYGRHDERGVLIPLALTQSDLASWVGASREAVSAALRSMRTRGWIETGRRRLLICDLAALRQLAL